MYETLRSWNDIDFKVDLQNYWLYESVLGKSSGQDVVMWLINFLIAFECVNSLHVCLENSVK